MKLEQIVKLKFGEAPKQEMKDYPWEECLADQLERYGDEETAKKVCGAIRAGMKKSFAEGDSLEGSCWEGYEPIGLKPSEDGSRMVPNCVPVKASKVKEGFPIPSVDGEDEEKYISRCISAIIDEYPAEGQAYAVCKAKYDEK
jgi:hypothetical protein